MVNIQIRGPLVHITVNQFTEHQMKDMINNKKNVSEFIFKNKDQKNIDNIFNNTFPILSATSEIHVSSFENDNYYDEGHTYFRASLSSITSGKKDYKIHSKGPLSKNTVISFMSGYGTGFETEIIDFDYKNLMLQDFFISLYRSKRQGFAKNQILLPYQLIRSVHLAPLTRRSSTQAMERGPELASWNFL